MQVDNRYLKHYGVDDTKWYAHRFGKWQPQAKYANGTYEDGTKVGSNYGDVKARIKEERKARRDAKNDYNIQMADRGDLGATIRLVSGKAAVANVIAGPLAGALYTSLATTKAIKGYNSRYGDNASYLNVGSKVRQANNANKSIQTRLSKSKIKDLKLSPEYVKAYSAAMDELIAKSKPIKTKVNKSTIDDKKLLNKIGILAPTATVTNALTTAVTGGTSLLGDVANVAKPIVKRVVGKTDSTGLPLLKSSETTQELLRNVNKGNKGLISKIIGGDRRNCTGCTAATELRMRGYDVSTGNYINGEYDGWIKTYFPKSKTIEWFSNKVSGKVSSESANVASKMETLTSNQLNTVLQGLSKQGSGARGAVTVWWDSGWGGHSLNYKVGNSGAVSFIDGQTGRIMDESTAMEYLSDRISSISTTRLDNISFDPSAIKRIVG